MTVTYEEIWDEVIGSGRYQGRMAKIKQIARMVFASKYEGAETKQEAVYAAYELYECFTGVYIDPTIDQYNEVFNAI